MTLLFKCEPERINLVVQVRHAHKKSEFIEKHTIDKWTRRQHLRTERMGSRKDSAANLRGRYFMHFDSKAIVIDQVPRVSSQFSFDTIDNSWRSKQTQRLVSRQK